MRTSKYGVYKFRDISNISQYYDHMTIGNQMNDWSHVTLFNESCDANKQ